MKAMAEAGGRSMRIVVLGRALSSPHGTCHGAIWRPLLRALAARGHRVLFLERDLPGAPVPHDLPGQVPHDEPDFCEWRRYGGLGELAAWRSAMGQADLVLLGSGTPDGIVVGRFIQRHAGGLTGFYDLDAPATLAGLRAGRDTGISPDLIPGFDLYLSATGGPALHSLCQEFGARAAHALYCAADKLPPAPRETRLYWDLGHVGAWHADRQDRLEALLIAPARRNPALRCVVVGAHYPAGIDWPANVTRIEHLAPEERAGFYAGLRFSLTLARAERAAYGYSPGRRLFEAAMCASPILSDAWAGLDELFGEDVRVVRSTEDVEAALALDETARRALGEAGRRRVLDGHTASHRAAALEAWVEAAALAGRGTGAAA